MVFSKDYIGSRLAWQIDVNTRTQKMFRVRVGLYDVVLSFNHHDSKPKQVKKVWWTIGIRDNPESTMIKTILGKTHEFHMAEKTDIEWIVDQVENMFFSLTTEAAEYNRLALDRETNHINPVNEIC